MWHWMSLDSNLIAPISLLKHRILPISTEGVWLVLRFMPLAMVLKSKTKPIFRSLLDNLTLGLQCGSLCDPCWKQKWSMAGQGSGYGLGLPGGSGQRLHQLPWDYNQGEPRPGEDRVHGGHQTRTSYREDMDKMILGWIIDGWCWRVIWWLLLW